MSSDARANRPLASPPRTHARTHAHTHACTHAHARARKARAPASAAQVLLPGDTRRRFDGSDEAERFTALQVWVQATEI
eukprot:6178910-Pleurochrysis_carterae.AAC.1